MGIEGNEALVLQYQESESESEQREILAELYRQNEGLIGKVASIYSGFAEMEDLRQEAFFGLHVAVGRWSPDGGSTFASYAWEWIRQALRRYLDENGSNIRVPSSRRGQILQYRKVCIEYERDFSERPSDREIMAVLGVSRVQLEEIKRADIILRTRSIYEELGDEGDGCVLADTVEDPTNAIETFEDRVWHEQLSAELMEIIGCLKEREEQIIRFRFFEKKTMKETGKILGVSTERVRQIEQQALRKLRAGKLSRRLRPYLEDIAVRYGYGASGLQTFKHKGASSVELAVLEVERQKEMWIKGRQAKAPEQTQEFQESE